MSRIRGCLLFTLMIGLLAAGYAWWPGAKKARHLERGDRYISQQQYREAIIEYRNVLKIEPTNSRGIWQLVFSYNQLGEAGKALPYLLKVKKLNPKDLDIRLLLAETYLADGKGEEALNEADFVLEQEPKHFVTSRKFEALMLFARVASTPEEVDAAIKRIKAMWIGLGDRAETNLALGNLYLRIRDMESAEPYFKWAIDIEPKSMEAHKALGNFYLAKRNIRRAEQAFKAAAKITPVGLVSLADFYLLLGRPDEAKEILGKITQKTPDFLPAWHRTAEIAFAEQKYDESAKALDMILKKNPSDIKSRLLRGRVRLAKRKTAEAVQDFRKVLKIRPKYLPAHYQLALAQIQTGNIQQAKGELKEVITIAPNFEEAKLLLAGLNVQTGDVQPAIEELERLVAEQPKAVRAHTLLGSAYLANGEAVKATEAYRKVAALAPNDPRAPYLVGASLRAQGKSAEAKKEFEVALTLAPGYLDPLIQLVSIAFTEERPDVALQRVKKQIARVPELAKLLHLLGGVYLARGNVRLAEAAYLKAVTLDPNLVGAYLKLGHIYAASGKYKRALAKVNEALKVNRQSLGTHVPPGLISEQNGNIRKAQKAYEEVLELNPSFAQAANNRAYLYAEHGGHAKKAPALSLAQTAQELLPDDLQLSDTLGWILGTSLARENLSGAP